MVAIKQQQQKKTALQEKVKVTILRSNQVDFKTKNITRDKEGFFFLS